MIRYAVVTLSDKGSRGERPDTSGPLAQSILQQNLPDAECVTLRLLPDEQHQIEAVLRELADEQDCQLIVTTGGTGFSPRDVTPEATRAVIHREAPGLAEAMRAAGLAVTPMAMASRAVCGLRNATLIINLSGSPKAVREQLAVVLPVLPHCIKVAQGEVSECAAIVRK